MKVVLFCGGAGMRLRGYSEDVPKPMVTVGARPVLWHIMKYYAHFGHKDFILCLGYKANVIKDYFLNYHARLSDLQVHLQSGRVEYANPTALPPGAVLGASQLQHQGLVERGGWRITRSCRDSYCGEPDLLD